MAAAHTVTGAAEPQLVKVHAAEPSGVPGSLRQPVTTEPPASSAPPFRQQSPRPEPRLFADDASRAADPRNDQRSRENGSSRYYQGQASNESARFASPSPVADDRFPQNGEARRRLHLSLPGNGHDSPHPPQSSDAAPADRYSAQPAYVQPNRPVPMQSPSTEPQPARMQPEAPRGKENGAIDHVLRERVDADIAAFLAAFDAALAHDSPETRAGLREATDRLLRAGARTRIELERLEARVPLAPRDRNREEAAAWRQR
jgi:hypothetical protein